MSNSYLESINPINNRTSQDGLILDVNTGDLGNADTSYTYFPLEPVGYNAFDLQYLITATTLTIEATDDDSSYANETEELNTTTNNRTFAGAGNWAADGVAATATVDAGVLAVHSKYTLSGAKLDRAYFNGTKGFEVQKRYTVTLTISGLSAGTVSVYAGNQLIASGLTDGAAQVITFKASKHRDSLRVLASDPDADFNLGNVLISPVAAIWSDITNTCTDGVASTITSSGPMTLGSPISWPRVRIKRLTTNATNALELRLTRFRI